MFIIKEWVLETSTQRGTPVFVRAFIARLFAIRVLIARKIIALSLKIVTGVGTRIALGTRSSLAEGASAAGY
jgi:hypothetical protein